MRFGLGRRDTTLVVIGVMAGWCAARFYQPVPATVLLSPRVQCGGIHEIGVPMLENAAWAAKSGKLYWSEKDKRWSTSPQWRTETGSMFVAKAPEGVQIVVRGMRQGNVSGSYIRAVKMPEEEQPKKSEQSEKKEESK